MKTSRLLMPFAQRITAALILLALIAPTMRCDAGMVVANDATVASKGTDNQLTAPAVDVCVAYSGVAPFVSIPYPVTGAAADSSTTTKVIVDSTDNVMRSESSIPKSTGDEPGTPKEVISFGGTASTRFRFFPAATFAVKFEGDSINLPLDPFDSRNNAVLVAATANPPDTETEDESADEGDDEPVAVVVAEPAVAPTRLASSMSVAAPVASDPVYS